MNDYFCLKTTYKIATKINVGNCSLTKLMNKMQMTFRQLKLSQTKRLLSKIKTKTKSKMPAKINTALQKHNVLLLL